MLVRVWWGSSFNQMFALTYSVPESYYVTSIVGLTVSHSMGRQIVGTLILTFVSGLLQKGKIHNMHNMAIPIQDTHTGNCFYEIVKQFLEGMLGTIRKDKFLSIATDGARNMTGRVSGAATTFGNVAHPGVFRVCCAAHQLDLVVQHLMSWLLHKGIWFWLNVPIAHLRRQCTLCQEMGTICPTVAGTHCCHWV